MPVVIAALYSAFMLLRSYQIKDEKTTIWALFKAFWCIHCSYGWGSLRALLTMGR
jgi:hypothetical protein